MALRIALCIFGGALTIAAAFVAPALALWGQGDIFIDFAAAAMAGAGIALILKNTPQL